MTNLIESQYEQKRQCHGRQSGKLITSYEDSVFTKKKIKASRFQFLTNFHLVGQANLAFCFRICFPFSFISYIGMVGANHKIATVFFAHFERKDK